MTLIELMVVSAISSILMLAAVALLVSMQRTRANSRRRLEKMDQTFTASATLERSLLNTGYHFPSARYGFRVFNNVASGTVQGQQVGGACDTCVVPNTDMFEIVEGSAGPFGRVSGGSIDAGLVLVPPGGPLGGGTPGVQLFMFSDGREESCLALGTVSSDGLALESLEYVDRETLAPQPGNYFPGSGHRNYNCPRPEMFVSVATRRQRFFVSESDAGTRALKVFNLAPTGVFPDAGSASILVNGVDNLQVIPLVDRADGGFATGCNGETCLCNLTGASCVISNTEFLTTERVVGAKIRLSVRSARVDRVPVSATPQLADETLPADDTRRMTQEQTFSFRNFVQVQP